jgi:diguanylate cyclase (GGDEF)-like protein
VELKELIVVTNDTFKELKKHEIVTPDLYKDIFEQKVKSHNSDDNLDDNLDDINVSSSSQVLQKALKLQNETKDNAILLKDSIDLATIAIKDNDQNALENVKEQMTSLQEKIKHLEEQIYIDELTTVKNRKWLFDMALKDDKFINSGSLSFIDLDRFKVINDSYGHLAGDKVLFLIGSLLRKLEDSEIVRYGGDEFLVISYKHNMEDLNKFLTSINESFIHKSMKFQENTFKLSISFGSCDFKENDNFHHIADIIDKKMYMHKRSKEQDELYSVEDLT